jgi:hypothetical protein
MTPSQPYPARLASAHLHMALRPPAAFHPPRYRLLPGPIDILSTSSSSPICHTPATRRHPSKQAKRFGCWLLVHLKNLFTTHHAMETSAAWWWSPSRRCTVGRCATLTASRASNTRRRTRDASAIISTRRRLSALSPRAEKIGARCALLPACMKRRQGPRKTTRRCHRRRSMIGLVGASGLLIGSFRHVKKTNHFLASVSEAAAATASKITNSQFTIHKASS